MKLPSMIRIRQKLSSALIDDIDGAIHTGIQQLRLEDKVISGQTVAVACSSRGIAAYDDIVACTVKCLQQVGLKPFIIPAMGSHGSGTARGQKQVLTDAGITEQRLGVPVLSSLRTVLAGVTEDQLPVFIDKFTFEADYLVPINRIKAHTMFSGEIESGLMKQLAIGLGKKKGSTLYHQAAFDFGLEHVIRTVARTVMMRKKVLFGVGIVENGYCQPANIGVFPCGQLEEMEKQYLVDAKRMEPALPLKSIDVLIVDEMGKDISGAGIDCNVIGRIDMPLLTENPQHPSIKRIVVCDLTKKSEGNAIGIGLADFATRRLVDKIDAESMYVNALSASDPEHVKIPMTLENDRQAIEAALSTIGTVRGETLKIVRIRNTKLLDELIVSEPCLADLAENPLVTVDSTPFQLEFDPDGKLETF